LARRQLIRALSAKQRRSLIINLDNLRGGISFWLSEKKNWGQDFLNGEYLDIYDARANGVTNQWWSATVNRLGKWSAYRGRIKPNTKTEIAEHGTRRLQVFTQHYATLMGTGNVEPNIADLRWEDAAPLFSLSSEIKPSSPVFPSKLCHFLFPKLFVPMDNEVIGRFEYEFYWRGMKDEWSRFDKKHEAREILSSAIRAGTSIVIHPFYPFETKIMELSHIGYNFRTPAR
jgi:hypothetical protein